MGIFLVSGSIDNRLFRDLKKAIIDDDTIRDSLKLISAEEKLKVRLRRKKQR